MSLILAVLAFGVSAWLTRRLSNPDSRLYKLDHPNPRSLHESPTPRGGGLAIFAAILVAAGIAAILYTAASNLAWLAVATFLIAGVSWLDDWLKIHLSYRIVVHVAAAGIVLWGGFVLGGVSFPGGALLLPEPLVIGFSLLLIVWMVNLYNFMDGMDGFAAGMALIGFGAFAVLGWLAGDRLFMTLNLILAGAAGGFLLFNFPPARIFMGDIGSSLLGFLVAVFIIWADRDSIFPLWLGALVFSPFIVDATVTLFRRILRGEKFWEAHRTHYYQRLVQLGWGHKRTVLWEYGLMLMCALSAVVAHYLTPSIQWVIIMTWLLAYVLLMLTVHRLEARHSIMVTR